MIILKQFCIWCLSLLLDCAGHAVAQLAEALRYKAVGSIPDSIIGIYHWRNTSGRTMALGLIQYLTEMSIMNIFWSVMMAGA